MKVEQSRTDTMIVQALEGCPSCESTNEDRGEDLQEQKRRLAVASEVSLSFVTVRITQDKVRPTRDRSR